MNPTVKKVLVIATKHAINAVLTNSVLMGMLPTIFNFHDRNGIWNLVKLTGTIVGSREAMVWLPLVLRWTTTNADPTGGNGAQPQDAPQTNPNGPSAPKPPVA